MNIHNRIYSDCYEACVAEYHVTSRRMSSDRDFDDVIAVHRSRDTAERRIRLYRRPGNNMAGDAVVSDTTRTCVVNVGLVVFILLTTVIITL